MNGETEQLLLAFFSSGSLKDELACVNRLILHVSRRPAHFVELLELMSPYILGLDKPDDEMVRAFKLVGEVLAKVKHLELSFKQKELLLGFFLRSMKKLVFVDVASRCLEVLLTEHMLRTDEHSARAGYLRFLELLEGDYWLTSAYVQPIRHRIYTCMLAVLQLRPQVVEGSETRFIKLALEHSGEEKDPRNLFVVLGVWNHLLALCPQAKVAQFTESIFEQVSVYFPIIFKNRSATSSITVEDLNEALNRCLSHEAMVEQFVALIFTKLLDGEEDVRLASVNGLLFVLEDGFGGRVLQNVHVLRAVISNLKALTGELRDHPDIKRAHGLVVQLLAGENLRTESRVLGAMLAKYLEDFMQAIREKPSSSDAHHHVGVLRDMMHAMPRRAKQLVLEMMWQQVHEFLAADKRPSMKIMLEHLILVCAKKSPSPDGPERLSARVSQQVYAVLSELLADGSYDLRLMALMCMKMTCSLLVPDETRLARLKAQLLLNMRSAGETESRCCVEVYFLVFNQRDVPEVEHFLQAAEEKRLDSLLGSHASPSLVLHAFIMHLKQNPQTDRTLVAFVQLLVLIFDAGLQVLQPAQRFAPREILPYMKTVVLDRQAFAGSQATRGAIEAAAQHMLATDRPAEAAVFEVLESLVDCAQLDVAPLVCASVLAAGANLGLVQHLLRRLRIVLPEELVDSVVNACVADEESRLHGVLQAYLATASLSSQQSTKLARYCCAAPDERRLRYLKGLMNRMADHVFTDALQLLPRLFGRPELLRLLLACGEDDNRLAVFRLYSAYRAEVRPGLDLQTRTKVDIVASDLLEYARATISVPDILSFVEAYHASLDRDTLAAVASLLLRQEGFDQAAVDRLLPLVEVLSDERDVERCVALLRLQMKLLPLAGAAERRRVLGRVSALKAHPKRIVRRHACDCYNEYICAYN